MCHLYSTFRVFQIAVLLSIFMVAVLSGLSARYIYDSQSFTNRPDFGSFRRKQRKVSAIDTIGPICPLFKPESSVVSLNFSSAKLYETRQKLLNHSIRVHVIGYANGVFQQSRRRIEHEARMFGLFYKVKILSPEDLSPAFAGFFGRILRARRGAGYWVWKVWIIREALEKVEYEDYVMYTDCGNTVSVGERERKTMTAYIAALEASEYGVLCYDSPYKEAAFCSGRVIDVFGIRNSTAMLQSRQMWAGFILLRKTDSVLTMLDKVIRLLFTDPWIITDRYGDNGSMPEFKENRHDQSLLSLTFKCHGVLIARHDKVFRPVVLPTRLKKA